MADLFDSLVPDEPRPGAAPSAHRPLADRIRRELGAVVAVPRYRERVRIA